MQTPLDDQLTQARELLARQQAGLLRALVLDDPPPEGIDPSRASAAAFSLFQKRKRAVAMAWPTLQKELGEQFDSLFANYAKSCPLPSDGGPPSDGRAFIASLPGTMVSDAIRREVLYFDLLHVQSANGARSRKWPVVRIARLLSRRWIMGVFVPRFGAIII